MAEPTENDQEKPAVKKEIFRKEAINEQFSSSRLNQILVVIRPLDWIIYTTLFVVLAAFFAWCFLGAIPVTVIGNGIILDPSQLTTVASKVDGIVEEIYTEQDAIVQPGQRLVKLSDPQLTYQYDFQKKLMEKQQKEYYTLVDQVEKEKQFRLEYLKGQLEAFEKAKEFKVQEIVILKSTLETEEALLAKNILTLPTVNSARLALLAAEADLGKIVSDLLNTKFEISKAFRQDEIWTKGKLVKDAELEYGLAKAKFDQTFVYADEAGQVVGTFVFPGMVVSRSAPLLTLQKLEKVVPPSYFFAYVPVIDAKAVRPGMPARVELTKYVFKKFGYIIGKVKEVSPLPLSDAAILTKLFNQSLVETLKEKSVVQIIIELEKNPETPTGYQWTSGRGPEQPITTGNFGVAQIVVDTIAPIYFILPNWGVGDEGPR